MSIVIDDITAGESWACYFKVRTFVDDDGKWVDTSKLKAGEPVLEGSPGDYKGFGIITTRDTAKRLVEVLDLDCEKRWVVSYEDCWGVDKVEWQE